MKIVHLCLSAFFIDNYSYQENLLPKYHVKQGHEVTVIASLFTFGDNGKGAYLPGPCRRLDKDGYNVIRLAYRKPVFYNRFFRHYVGLKKELDAIGPDVIFIHNASFGDAPIVRQYIKKHPNTKVFADSHTDYINSAKNWLSSRILHPIIWRHYSKILEPYMIKCFGVTPMRCRFLKEMYKVNPAIVEYLPLGVDDDLIPTNREEVKMKKRRELGVADDDFLLVTGGKIDKLKNTHILIEAIKRLSNPKIHLVICGVLTPEMEYLKKEFESNQNIHYLGWCNAEQVMDCMVAADLACFPGTHSTLWEQSVGVGLPAVFKRWPEMEHVNVNGNCFFVKGEDVEELQTILLSLLSSDKYHQMQDLAKEASNMFLYSEIAKRAISEK